MRFYYTPLLIFSNHGDATINQPTNVGGGGGFLGNVPIPPITGIITNPINTIEHPFKTISHVVTTLGGTVSKIWGGLGSLF